MSKRNVTYFGGPIFDGERLLDGHAALFEDGLLAEIRPMGEITGGSETIDLNGDILSPGYVDLQVNGGDGIMFNDDPSIATLRRIAAAHRSLGATRILPTLILLCLGRFFKSLTWKATDCPLTIGLLGPSPLVIPPHVD